MQTDDNNLAKRSNDASTPEERWAELIRRGVVKPATERLTGPPPNFPIMTFDELMKEIEADREDRA